MKILGVDPGVKSPGFSVWHGRDALIWAQPTLSPYSVDVIVCESGWPHGKMGKVQMWGLGFGAAWHVRDALALSPDATVYTIAPKAWRAALGGLPANAPKAVIVARLRQIRYREYVNVESWTDDVVEACGIAEATAILLARPLKKDRVGLKEVKR